MIGCARSCRARERLHATTAHTERFSVTARSKHAHTCVCAVRSTPAPTPSHALPTRHHPHTTSSPRHHVPDDAINDARLAMLLPLPPTAASMRMRVPTCSMPICACALLHAHTNTHTPLSTSCDLALPPNAYHHLSHTRTNNTPDRA
jgi:hypothetical protein